MADLSSARYEPATIDLTNKNCSQSLAIEKVGRHKRVLEIGTSTGYVSKILKEQGNQVIGIEFDKDAGEIARQYCKSMIIGDIEELDLDEYISSASIDVILMGDVLEHLRNPGLLLSKIRKYLKPDGYLVVSIPNVSHGDLLLNLLNGDFRYTPVGLLDETHLRFFGRRNIIKMFNEQNYVIKDINEIRIPVGSTELKMDLNKIPPAMIKFIKTLPDSDVYQFVFKAIPSDNSSNEVVLDADFKNIFDIIIEDAVSNPLREANAKAASLDQEIREMQRSITWQTTMRFHNCIVERALPHGSNQRKYYELCIRGGRRLVNEGWSSFWWNFKNYVRFSQNKNNIGSVSHGKDKVLVLKPNDLLPIGNARIAVIIHLYYIDLFQEICSYLKNIPVDYTLLISVTNEENKVKVADQLKNIRMLNVLK